MRRRFGTRSRSIASHRFRSIRELTSLAVENGITCDFGGVGYQQLSDDDKEVILLAYPRLNMKKMLTTCLCDVAKKSSEHNKGQLHC